MGYYVGPSTPAKLSSSSERDKFFDFRSMDNVKNITPSIEDGLDESTLKEYKHLWRALDTVMEDIFDSYAEKNPQTVADIMKKPGGPDILQLALQELVDRDETAQGLLNNIKEVIDAPIKIELNTDLKLFSLYAHTPAAGSNYTTTQTGPGNTSGSPASSGPGKSLNQATSVIRQEKQTETDDGDIGLAILGGGQDRDPSLGHNSLELAQFGPGDQMYSSITYADEFLTKSQRRDMKKNGDGEFDPSAKSKAKYKNKDIEYREKKKQVADAVVHLLGDMLPDDAGKSDRLTRSDVKKLDRDRVPDIMYLITHDDANKLLNTKYGLKEKLGANKLPWRSFATPETGSVNGIYIPKDKQKDFKNMVNTLGYKGNINKLIQFLNYFNTGGMGGYGLLDGGSRAMGSKKPIDMIATIIDIGIGRGKAGKMQLIETSNIKKITEQLSGTEVSNPEHIFATDSWDEIYTRSGSGKQDLLSETIDTIEETGTLFELIADVNNDGRIDKFDVGPSITGLAFYNMLLDVGNKKRQGQEFVIVNGPQTSLVLKNLITKAASVSQNYTLKAEVHKISQQEFVHTYHVAELIKKYPELKTWMLVDIQSEMEYAQNTRKVDKTYEIFNPELARSLLRDETSDPIEDYFTGEPIRKAFGDIHESYIAQLKQIANKEGRTLNRKVSTKFFEAMGVFMDTLFLNFGPLMRTLQLDWTNGWTDQRFGNSVAGVSGNIPLKNHLNTSWNEQEKRQFIQNNAANIQKRVKQSSLQPSIGVTEGAQPLVGFGYNMSKEIADASQKRKKHNVVAGVSVNPLEPQVFVGVNAQNQRQTSKNFKKLQDINTTNTTIKSKGIEYGAGAMFNTNNIAETGLMARFGVMTGREHLMGIEQHKLAFENFLEPLTKELPANILNARPTDPGERSTLYNQDVARFYLNSFPSQYKNDEYRATLNAIVTMFVGYLEQQRVLENLSKQRNPALSNSEKQKIIQAYMGQRIDGFVAAIDQSKLAKLNAQGVKFAEFGASGGVNLTPNALKYGGPFGALVQARIKLRVFDEVYGDDPHDINSVSKQLDYGAGMRSLDIQPEDTIDVIAKKLDLSLGINNLQIETAGDKLVFRNRNGGSVLDLLHLYYTPEAFEKAGFSFDGEKLTVGNVGQIGVSNVFKGMYKSHYLILGSDKMIGCRWHNKGQYDAKTKTTMREALYPTDTEGNEQETNYMQSKTLFLLPGVDSIRASITSMSPQAQNAITPFIRGVDTQGQLLLQPDKSVKRNNISNNTIPSRGTLSFLADKTGKITDIVYSDTPNTNLEIAYKQLTIENPAPRHITTTESIELDNMFTFPEAKILLSPNNQAVYSKLKSFDNTYKDTYFQFMAQIKNIDNGGITTDDYQTALRIIKDTLITHVNNAAFSELLTSLAADENKLIYVINRLKAIFADNYSHGFKTTANIKVEMTKRGQTYSKETVLGPSGKQIPTEMMAVRNQIANRTDTPTLGERPNLFGYTAWYRNGGQQAKARGYSATALGDTRVLEGYMQTINDKQDTKAWMIDNLKQDKASLAHMSNNINKNLSKTGMSLDDAQVLELLQSKDHSIDIGNKKLRIDMSWYFYLLGECANESVGFELNGITIDTSSEGPSDDSYIIETTTIQPDSVRGITVKMSKSTHTIDTDVKAKKADLNLIGQTGVKIQKTPQDGVKPGGENLPIDGVGGDGENGPINNGTPDGESG